MTSDRNIEMIIFDLDETLYPRSAGLIQAIGRRINAYLQERMGMTPSLAVSLQRKYFEEYGTSLRGLQIHHDIDPEDYVEFVHDVPLTDYIDADPALQTMLSEIDVRKAIFTNATVEHARSVTRILGIEQFFERVIDVRSNDFVGKPYLAAYQHAVDVLGVQPECCVLVEDSVRNLGPGKQLGMATVLVGGREPVAEVVDFHCDDVLGVAEVIARLDKHPQPPLGRQDKGSSS